MKPLLSNFLPVLLSLFLVVGAVAVTDSKPKDIAWGQGDGSCRIGCKGFPTTTAAGDPVDGVIVVENLGKEIIPIMHPSGRPVGQIEVVAVMDNDVKVPDTSYASGDPLWGGSVILQKVWPGQRVEIPIRLNRLIDMTRAGEYHVTLTFRYSTPFATTRPAPTEPAERTVSSKQLNISVGE